MWIPRNTEELERLVKEKNQTANRLQKAEVVLLKKANIAKKRLAKAGRGHPDLETGYQTAVTAEKKESTTETTISEKPVRSSSSNGSNDDTISHVPGSPKLVSEALASPYAQPGALRTDYSYEPPIDINGSFAAQWIPHESRPSHRPLANYGRRVDTIKWTRIRIKDLAPKIAKLKKIHRAGRGKAIPSAFVEFSTQADAQSAYQTLTHHRAFHMCPEIVGVSPPEIVWTSLRMKWWERVVRKFGVQAFISAMVIFWAIPAAAVGTISNITLLSEKVSFLSWIMLLPSPILGLIQGLLPAVALAFLMSLVPGIVRSELVTIYK